MKEITNMVVLPTLKKLLRQVKWKGQATFLKGEGCGNKISIENRFKNCYLNNYPKENWDFGPYHFSVNNSSITLPDMKQSGRQHDN